MAKSRDQYIWENSESDYSADLASFSLVDEATVARRQREGDITLPAKKVDIPKDERWNTKQMNSKLLQGILNGDSIPKIANSLKEVIGNNEASAIRNARTMTTGAENEGRLDSYKNLDSQGVVQKKVWIATADARTRKTHIEVDGEEIDIDDQFSNGLMYPADPHGDASEVYNCRCSMRTHIIGFRKKDGSISKVQYGRDRTLHDDQMAAEKARRLSAGETIKPKSSATKPKGDQNAYNALISSAKANRIDFNQVNEMADIPTREEIIEKLAGGDQTKGSCASLGLSYCANMTGLDVTDFRGGSSQGMFSRDGNIINVCRAANADLQITIVSKEARDAAKILSNLPEGKEFFFAAGRHAAIVKNEGGVIQYLEMQSSTENGWKPFAFKKTVPAKVYDFNTGQYVDTTRTISRTVAETLNMRFGCRKTVSGRCFYASVDSFQNTDEFKEILGYINTATGSQMKGVKGGIK